MIFFISALGCSITNILFKEIYLLKFMLKEKYMLLTEMKKKVSLAGSRKYWHI